MTEPFLSLGASERADILNTVAARNRRPAVILEKDIWVCWVLQALFSMPNHHPMAFKGGTSLSKVYGIIDRFSEDVDITLDYRAFDEEFQPFAQGTSRNRIRRFSECLRGRVAGYVRQFVVPALDTAAERLAHDGSHNIKIGDDGESVRFAYPSAVEVQSSYIASEILLEFGGRNVIDPNERHEICPEIATHTPELSYPSATVSVLSPARTFWEKATLIHVACHRRQLAINPDRLSRHWFDLDCLGVHAVGRAALSDRALLEDVVRHKKVFFHAGNANYDNCINGRLRLVPDEDQIPVLRSDYEAMQGARIVGSGAPGFDTMIKRIHSLEAEINRSD